MMTTLIFCAFLVLAIEEALRHISNKKKKDKEKD